MKIYYPAKITRAAREKYWLVEFPDLPGCLTQGDSLEDAKHNAREALTGWLASVFERNLKIPEPTKRRGKNIYNIEPEPEVAVPVFLRKQREARKLTQSDVAKVLGISYQSYQRLEKPGKSNPTLKTLDKLAKVFQKELHLDFA